VVIGTPDDAIAQIRRLQQKGAFGTFLMLAHNWADFERTKKSYELFARHVLPVINDNNAWRAQSLTSYTDNKQDMLGRAGSALMKTFEKHQADIARAVSERKREET
jgi:limonene 1,2-monooxygenase